MPSKLNLSYKDRAGQKSNAQFYWRDIDAANHDAVKTEMTALETAINGITLGNLNTRTVLAEATTLSQGTASNHAARRELKWLLTYEDDVTGDLFSSEIPCPDVTNADLFQSGNEEFADLASTEWAAFKTAFDQKVRTPNGNDATLKSAKVVGRNL